MALNRGCVKVELSAAPQWWPSSTPRHRPLRLPSAPPMMSSAVVLSGAPAPCFTPLSSRVLPSPSAGPALAAWCPTQDLLAMVVAPDAGADGVAGGGGGAAAAAASAPARQTLHIHRLNWNRILAQE